MAITSGAAHLFADEAKRPSYLFVATVVPSAELAASRRLMRSLLLGNQRRIHFHDERESRKRQILASLVGLSLTARIYTTSATKANELDARKACLHQMVTDAAAMGAARLVIERDDSLLTHDRQTLYQAVAKAGCHDTLRYEHLRAHEEYLLSAPDAIAWCWSHGSTWRERVKAIVTSVTEVR